MNSEAPPALWKRIRDLVADGRLYYLNLPRGNEIDEQAFFQHIFEEGIVTITDWGLWDEGAVRLADDGAVLTPDTVHGDFADPMAGQIKWDELRDRMHEEIHSDRDSKVKAGREVSTIRKFVEEIDEGDVVMVRSPDGVVPAIITGPTRYDINSDIYEMGARQAFSRDVEWAATDQEPIAIPQDSLPANFGPGRMTVGRIADPSPVVGLLRGLEWIGNRDNVSWRL